MPALGAIGRSPGVQDPGNLQLVVSLFIGGMVLGELIFGPVSDAVGRRRTIMAGLYARALSAQTRQPRAHPLACE